jgi:hypothetical protein
MAVAKAAPREHHPNRRDEEAAMLQFLLLMLAFAQPATPSREISGPDPIQGPTPVTDKDVGGMAAPQCANRDQEQRAMEDRIKGWTPECIVKPRKRERAALDQKQPHP